MLWLVLLLCLGLVGLTGYFRGPILTVFSLFGMLCGLLLAGPLSALTLPLVNLTGYHPLLWRFYLPQAVAFVGVLAVFLYVGKKLDQKAESHFQEMNNEVLLIRWHRLYRNLGLSVGLLNGAVWFFLILLPIYVGGYFTTEAAGANAPLGARVVTSLRNDLHDSGLDRVVAAHDPLPEDVYQASDILDLILQNPDLDARLSHYPPVLTLAEMKEIKEVSSDPEIQKLFETQSTVGDFLAQTNVQALINNPAFTQQVGELIGQDLPDLQNYLLTGKSAKYDAMPLAGYWLIDVSASLAEERKHKENITARQIANLRQTLLPLISGMALSVRLDNQFVLKKENPDTKEFQNVGEGTWKNSGESFEMTLPGNNPETFPVYPDADGTLEIPRDSHILVFKKQS